MKFLLVLILVVVAIIQTRLYNTFIGVSKALKVVVEKVFLRVALT